MAPRRLERVARGIAWAVSSEDTSAQAGVSARVNRAILMLHPAQREAVELYWLRQMSYQECAVALRISRQAVARRVHRGLKNLRGLLEGMDYGE